MNKKVIIAGYVLGALLGVLGLVGIIAAPSLIQNMVASNIKLQPGTDVYNSWLNPPVEIHMSFYFFNLKNPADFAQGAKPLVEQVGPFVYREHILKDEVIDNQNNSITYKERRWYQFQPELSVANESFQITTINMAPVTVLELVRYMPSWVHDILNVAFGITNDTLIIKKNVNELLFGYQDNFLHTLRELAGIFKDLLPSDEIGFFTGRNNTVNSNYTILTGADDYKKIGRVESWNGVDKLNFWTTPQANMINGTDGTVFPAFMEKEPRLYMFVDDLCRSLYLSFNREDTLRDFIKVYTFAPTPELYAVVEENRGFCVPADNCPPAGILNLTECQKGIPIMMSPPHFLYADPKFIKEVDGLNPDVETHNTFLSIEPTTGFVMKANKRLQFNVQLKRDSRVSITEKIPEVMFPLFWLDENFVVDKKSADQYYSQVKLPLDVLNIGKFVLFGVGIALIVLSGLFHWRLSKRSSYESFGNVNTSATDEHSSLLNNESRNDQQAED